MSHNVYDTETSDLPLWSEPSDDPRQPHIVSMAWVAFTADAQQIGEHYVIVKPDGWRSAPKALETHGITYEQGMDEGIPEKQVVHQWVDEQENTDLRICHNPHFDDRIMKIAMLRAGYSRSDIEAILGKPKFDTCRAATKIMNLAPSDKMMAANMKMAKSPKLIECAKHFFNVEADGAHNALWDARMCARVYWHLQRPGGQP